MNSTIASSNSIQVQQVLHGYEEGHRLLASSYPISIEARREMLALSDLSGSSAASGFEDYLTGYPLVGTPFYALARTWLAPEMKRPGCVWTHTLLIEMADLAHFESLPQLHGLLDLLKRPTKDFTIGDREKLYGKPLTFFVPSLSKSSNLIAEYHQRIVHSFSPDVSRALMESLYGTAEPIVLCWKDANSIEELVLLFWMRQWPRLRRDFAFCTGVTAMRLREKRPFDLQVASRSTTSALRREQRTSCFIDETGFVSPSVKTRITDEEQETRGNLWLEIALRDLAVPNASLRDFVRFYGADIVAQRENYPSLIHLYALVEQINQITGLANQRIEVATLIEAVAEMFPRPREAATFKKNSFGVPAPNRVLQVADNEVLWVLSTTPSLSCLDREMLDMQPRVETLWRVDRLAAQKLVLDLVKNGKNPLVEDVVTAVANQITPSQAVELLRKSPSLGAAFIRHNRSLVHSPSLWSGSVNLQHELFDVLTRYDLTQAEQKKIAAAIFNADAESLAGELRARFEANSVESILEQLQASPRVLSETWQNLLKSRSDIFTHWLRYEIETQCLSTDLLGMVVVPSLLLFSPYHQEFSAIKAESWLKLLEAIELANLISEELSPFVLSLAFSHSLPEWGKVVEQSFQSVHSMLAREELPHFAWRWLDGQLPSLGYNNDWDKCERLRLALIHKFFVNKWPVTTFVNSVREKETLVRIIISCQSSDEGEKLWKMIHKGVKDNTIVVPLWQKPLWGESKKGLKAFLKTIIPFL